MEKLTKADIIPMLERINMLSEKVEYLEKSLRSLRHSPVAGKAIAAKQRKKITK